MKVMSEGSTGCVQDARVEYVNLTFMNVIRSVEFVVWSDVGLSVDVSVNRAHV